jgi:hypothetical protein
VTTEANTESSTASGVILTDIAAVKVKSLIEQEGRDDLRLRIAVQPGGCSGLRYQLFFDERSLDGDDRRHHRLRGPDRRPGLHHRQPERAELLRLWRLVPLIGRHTAHIDQQAVPFTGRPVVGNVPVGFARTKTASVPRP